MSEPNLTRRERLAQTAIVDAMAAIRGMDDRRSLTFNNEELTEAIHVLQSFVKQHVCWRHWPSEWSDWWEEIV